ncbi:MBL fold metallo-hydrolase [Bacillus fonticola]|uniref:MBL fold metallo-hydrolase n=1 Tax=Bacillus fonticola TaxID=2728853 RepID=UPI001474AE0B|nr:MBL fold metallo-hydrolase [Bacillus fonticola]
MWRQLKQGCFVMEGAVNIGYITDGKTGVLIDAGLDKQAANKVLRTLQQEGLPLQALICTHAHADHYGGALSIVNKTHARVYAPSFEAMILEHPYLEPLYLFHGAEPPASYRVKFLEGPAVKVDEHLHVGETDLAGLQLAILPTPGHSTHQVSVAYNGVLYASDAYFGREALEKHGVPYIVNAKQTKETLHMLLETAYEGAIPGHGPFEEEYHKTIQMNLQRHEEVEEALLQLAKEPITFDELVATVCETFRVSMKAPTNWSLYRTAVSAYISPLVDDGVLELYVENYRLWVQQRP